MIRIEHLYKTFRSGAAGVRALVDVSLEIEKGSIFGIIGFSGAGKSTLVRCLNLLERPTSGKVFVGGKELTAMKESEVRKSRKKISMIFQLFNLMKSRTVLGNVLFPLRGSSLSLSQRRSKAIELLKIVGLEEKLNAYPSELSGGQKQRVAIARALASDPEVLLCDEATSALDPQTTQDILSLIKDLNRKLGITVIVITHEMAVVKQICDSVAVMENGSVVEKGDIYTVFSNPQMPITRRFIGTTDGVERVKGQIDDIISPLGLSKGDTVVELSFHGSASGHALVSNLSRKFDIDISIIYGNIEMLDGKPLGKMITVFRGKDESIRSALSSIDGESIFAEVMYHAE
ncbi:MAG: ATP-binding cassette domain-containing protein [Clostridia bacterium]|nr:ATP-binding cassette domain-containing protein [Clostridia bacterium]